MDDMNPSLPEETEGLPVEETSRDSLNKPAKQGEDARNWYVIHCYSGYENKVRKNLEQRIETMSMKDKIFDVVIPTQKKSKSATANAARLNATSSQDTFW